MLLKALTLQEVKEEFRACKELRWTTLINERGSESRLRAA